MVFTIKLCETKVLEEKIHSKSYMYYYNKLPASFPNTRKNQPYIRYLTCFVKLKTFAKGKNIPVRYMEQQWNKFISIGRLPVRCTEVNQININHFTLITAGALMA